ncbi:MAG: hypothetical protein WCB85_12745 [Candidatus Dormiibacterota bacterium]
MTKPVTIRLELPDYERLEGEAKSLGMRPGTLAKVLLHSSLTKAGATQAEAALAALERLGALSAGKPAVDIVQLVHQARRDLGEAEK